MHNIYIYTLRVKHKFFTLKYREIVIYFNVKILIF